MSSNLQICVQAVIPIFILLLIGYIVRKTGIVDGAFTSKLNSVCFKVLFPFLMFHNIYSSDIASEISGRLVVFAVTAVMCVYAAAVLLTVVIEKEPASRGALIQAIYRSNFVIMGMPLAMNIYGHGNVGVTAVMIAVIVPLFNVLAVITLEVFRKGSISVTAVIKNILTNPLILGALAGVLFSLAGIRLPQVIADTVGDIASCATPAALMILGASFEFSSVKRVRRNLAVTVFARLIAVPAAVLSCAYAMGFRGIGFVTLIGVFSAPCAVSSFTMAKEMESDYELAGASVVFTSAAACLTMFMWLYIFKSMGAF